MAGLSAAAAGRLLIFDGKVPLGFQSSAAGRDAIDAFIANGEWKENERIPHYHQNPFTGFVIAEDYYPAELLARETLHRNRLAAGLDSQAGTIIPMPSGELAVFVVDKWQKGGRFTPDDIAALNFLHPHIARAGLMAARLGLAQAQATVSALSMMGLPAGVMTAAGRMFATNALFDAMPRLFLSIARGGLRLADESADLLLKEAIAASQGVLRPAIRSIPIGADDERPPLILHVLPLCRAAHEIFSGADILLVATPIGASFLVPSPTILTGLFDLTPAEAKLASTLASGKVLQEAAIANGITVKTARTYLERIFRKTGTRQQSELVALLKSAGPITPAQ